jgi:hypothetical protein
VGLVAVGRRSCYLAFSAGQALFRQAKKADYREKIPGMVRPGELGRREGPRRPDAVLAVWSATAGHPISSANPPQSVNSVFFSYF